MIPRRRKGVWNLLPTEENVRRRSSSPLYRPRRRSKDETEAPAVPTRARSSSPLRRHPLRRNKDETEAPSVPTRARSSSPLRTRHHIRRTKDKTEAPVAPTRTVQHVSRTEEDDESSEDSSVLSRLEDRSYYSEKGEHAGQKLHTLEQKWDDLERQFAARQRLLERITSGRSRDFVRQLREREQAVRHRTFAQLLQAVEARDAAEQERFQKRLDDEDESFLKGHPRDHDGDDDSQDPTKIHSPRRRTLSQRCYEWCVFELNSSVPAMYCLIVHSLAHIAIYQGIGSVTDTIRNKLSDTWDPPFFTFEGPLVDVALFFWGVLLLRLTGDLYWWLPDQDYDFVKFDLHNRLRLRCWDACFLSAVRARYILRAALFWTGHYYTYVSTIVLLSHMQRPFDQRSELLENLPSANLEAPQQCLLVSFCTKTCQDEIERQGAFVLVNSVRAWRGHSLCASAPADARTSASLTPLACARALSLSLALTYHRLREGISISQTGRPGIHIVRVRGCIRECLLERLGARCRTGRGQPSPLDEATGHGPLPRLDSGSNRAAAIVRIKILGQVLTNKDCHGSSSVCIATSACAKK